MLFCPSRIRKYNVRKSLETIKQEIQTILYYLQIWYEIICDIQAGSELLMAPKAPLQLRDIINDSSPLDQYASDKDTGEHTFPVSE